MKLLEISDYITSSGRTFSNGFSTSFFHIRYQYLKLIPDSIPAMFYCQPHTRGDFPADKATEYGQAFIHLLLPP
jgi:hypothetical protein